MHGIYLVVWVGAASDYEKCVLQGSKISRLQVPTVVAFARRSLPACRLRTQLRHSEPIVIIEPGYGARHKWSSLARSSSATKKIDLWQMSN